MKLRIKGHSVRLRVSRSELDQIGRGDDVIEKTCFGRTTLSVSLGVDAASDQIAATFENNSIRVRIPSALAHSWVHSDEVSLRETQKTPEGELQLLVEKDFQCLSPRDEDESDLFAHPKAGTEFC